MIGFGSDVGLDYEHVAFEPVTIEDPDLVLRTFQFRIHVFSDLLSLEAMGFRFKLIIKNR